MFDSEIAERYGVNCAIILQNIYFWIAKNKANNNNFKDGAYWTYNSIKAFQKLFPYLTYKQIRSAIDLLCAEEIIRKGNYNENSYDHTSWFCLTDKGESLFQCRQTDLPCKADHDAYKGESSYTDINHIVNTDIVESDPEQEKNLKLSDSVKEIVDYLNTKANTKFKSTSAKTRCLVSARIKEGFTIDDFKTVIDKMTKEWLNDPRMCKYIRTETLFSNKFEGYLNMKVKGKSSNSNNLKMGVQL